MRNTLKIFCALVAISFLFLGCSPEKKEEAPVRRDPAPDFRLQDLSQNSVALSSYQGRHPVLLLFWATWCPYCRQELARMNQKYRELAKDGLVFLAVDVREAAEKVNIFMQSHNLTFRVLLDTDTRVAEAYGLVGIPTYVLIGKKGSVLFKDNAFPQQYQELISRER